MVGLLPWCISLFAKPQHGCKPQKVPAGSVFADQSDTASTVHCGNCAESELFPILLYVLISLVFLHNVNDAHAHVRKFKSWLSWQVGWLSACPLRRWYRWCDCGPAQWGLQLCWTSFFWIIIDVTWCHIVYLSISLSLCPTTARMDHTGGRCLPETVSIFQLQRWQGQEQVTSCDEVVRNKMHRTREMRRMEAAAKWAKKDRVEIGYCCCGNAFWGPKWGSWLSWC